MSHLTAMRQSERYEAAKHFDVLFGSALSFDRAFFGELRGRTMETRIAVIAIIVEDLEAADEVNRILHEYSSCVIGRMGIPYRQKNLSLISVAVDAPSEMISALTGKLGNVPGISVKTAYQKL